MSYVEGDLHVPSPVVTAPLPRNMAASQDSATGHRPTSTTALIPPTFYPDGQDAPKTSAPNPSAQKKN